MFNKSVGNLAVFGQNTLELVSFRLGGELEGTFAGSDHFHHRGKGIGCLLGWSTSWFGGRNPVNLGSNPSGSTTGSLETWRNGSASDC